MGGKGKAKAKRLPWCLADMQTLQAVALPVKIRCGRCSKHLSPRSYSEKQLNDYRYQILREGRLTKPINCQKCTGSQVVEIECVVCHKTQGLERFAKSQRQDTDTARCFDCTEELVTREPIKEETYRAEPKKAVKPVDAYECVLSYQNGGGSINGSSTTEGWTWTDEKSSSVSGGVALSKRFDDLSITDSGYGILIEGESPCLIDQQSDGTRTRSFHTAPSGTASTNDGFTLNNHQSANASSALRTGTTCSYASSVANYSNDPDIHSTRWARISTGSNMLSAGDAHHEVQEDIWAGSSEEEYEDESEDDDNDNDDDDDDDTVI